MLTLRGVAHFANRDRPSLYLPSLLTLYSFFAKQHQHQYFAMVSRQRSQNISHAGVSNKHKNRWQNKRRQSANAVGRQTRLKLPRQRHAQKRRQKTTMKHHGQRNADALGKATPLQQPQSKDLPAAEEEQEIRSR
jgi:hypothetical protein